jgi:hypothetical protein
MAGVVVPMVFPVDEIKLIIRKLKGEDVPFWDLLKAAKVLFDFVTEKAKDLKDLFQASPVMEFSDFTFQASLENLVKELQSGEVGFFDWKSLALTVAKFLARLILDG